MSFVSNNLAYDCDMDRKRKDISIAINPAASKVPITGGQSAGLSPENQPKQDFPGSFTSCEDCGLQIPGEISDSDIAALLDFFLIVDRWDREARGETVFVSTWERFYAI